MRRSAAPSSRHGLLGKPVGNNVMNPAALSILTKHGPPIAKSAKQPNTSSVPVSTDGMYIVCVVMYLILCPGSRNDKLGDGNILLKIVPILCVWCVCVCEDNLCSQEFLQLEALPVFSVYWAR